MTKQRDDGIGFDVTCAASRHAELIADELIEHGSCGSLAGEGKHAGESIRSAVRSLYRARAEIKRLAAEVERLKSPAWIPATKWLPPRNEIVLVIDQFGVSVGSYSPMLDDWWTLQGQGMTPGAIVSYWTPLPAPPVTREGE